MDISQVMTTFMQPPPAATFLVFHPQDNNIIAVGMEDSSIQIYNVRVDEVTMKRNEGQFKILISWMPLVHMLGDCYCIQRALH